MSDTILFLCVANSARSQMAEGLARMIRREMVGGEIVEGDIEVYSAGSRPAVLHPLAARALHECGIDTTDHFSKGIDAVPLNRIRTVITLCEEEVCPRLPETVTHLHWPMPDPAAAQGGELEQLASFRSVRDTIAERLREWFRSASQSTAGQL